MTDKLYQHELGQAAFGQPPQDYEASEIMEAALRYLSHELERVLHNRLPREVSNPFDNSAATFDSHDIAIHAYSWGDDDQPWNLKCGDVEVSWYKHSGRGVSVNKPMSPDDVSRFLDVALAAIRDCDTCYSFDGPKRGGKPFTYNGELCEWDEEAAA